MIFDFKKDRYYKQIFNYRVLYFKFEKMDDIFNIHSYKYYIFDGKYNTYSDGKYLKIFIHSDHYFEVGIEEFVKYLPDNHIEKLHYYRNLKINYLLKL